LYILSPHDAAYAASAMDCEGCISIYRVKNKNRKGVVCYTYGCKVIVGNTNRILTDWLYAKFGGNLQLRIVPDKKNKDCYLWSLSRKQDIHDFLQAVKPYMKIKCEQLQLMLDYQSLFNVNDPAKRAPYRLKMMELNKKGRSVTTNTQDTTTTSKGSHVVKIEPEHFRDEVRAPRVSLAA